MVGRFLHPRLSGKNLSRNKRYRIHSSSAARLRPLKSKWVTHATVFRTEMSKSLHSLFDYYPNPVDNCRYFLGGGRNSPQGTRTSPLTRFLDHTQRRITVARTPLDEWLVHRRDLYLTKDNTHNRHTSMPPVGFEPTISAGERPQNYVLDRAATGIGIAVTNVSKPETVNFVIS